jgi:hypothetical protein
MDRAMLAGDPTSDNLVDQKRALRADPLGEGW